MSQDGLSRCDHAQLSTPSPNCPSPFVHALLGMLSGDAGGGAAGRRGDVPLLGTGAIVLARHLLSYTGMRALANKMDPNFDASLARVLREASAVYVTISFHDEKAALLKPYYS